MNLQFYPIDYIAKDVCIQCKQFFEYRRDSSSCARLCHRCFYSIPHQPSITPVTDGDTTLMVSSVVPYTGWPRDLVHELKYQWKFSCAHDLAFFLEIAFWALADQFAAYPTIIPVPLHWTRRLLRGYNQSELLAEALADRVGFSSVSRSLLRRSKRTRPQFGLPKEEREKNLKDAFIVPAAAQVPKTIILIDDVLTTGNTLLQAAKPLYKRGAQQVFALTATRALLDKDK